MTDFQGDLTCDNANGAQFRTDVNNQLKSLGTKMAGSSAPSTTFRFLDWVDTTNGLVKWRNANNDDWVSVATIDGGLVVRPGASGNNNLALSFSNDTDTGFYRGAANTLNFHAGGADVLTVTAAAATFSGAITTTSDLTINANTPNGSLKVGDSSELLVFRDSSHSYIRNGENNLIVESADKILLRADSDGSTTHEGIEIDNTAIKLTTADTLRATIDSNGINVPLTVFCGTLDLIGNSDKILFGASDDCEVYHTGSNYKVDNNTGNIEVTSVDRVDIDAVNGCRFHCNGSEKFRIDSGGGTLSGDWSSSANMTHSGNITHSNGDSSYTNGIRIGGTGSEHKIDSYEEGSKTVYCNDDGTSSTGTSATMYWTRIGNTCTVWVAFYNLNTSGQTGDVKIGVLPFTSSTRACASIWYEQINSGDSDGEVQLSAFIDGSSTTLVLHWCNKDGTTADNLHWPEIDNGQADISLTMTYRI